MEEGFFRKATAAEHDAVVKNERKMSGIKFILGFSVVALALILIGDVFNLKVNTSLPLSDRSLYLMPWILVVLLMLTVFIIWLIVVRKKHMSKIRNGDYAVQTVMVLGSSYTGKLKRSKKVTLISEDGLIYIADITSPLGKEIEDKSIGLLVMINVKKCGILDEYRFIPVSEYDPDFTQKGGAFSVKGTKPVFDPRKNKLDPRFNKVSPKAESKTEKGMFTIHPESDTVIDHRLNRASDRKDPDDIDNN